MTKTAIRSSDHKYSTSKPRVGAKPPSSSKGSSQSKLLRDGRARADNDNGREPRRARSSRNGKTSEAEAELIALRSALIVVEFDTTGAITSANDNFLQALGHDED